MWLPVCTNLCRMRHVGLQRNWAQGQQMLVLNIARHYLQAPEARPVPTDDRSPPDAAAALQPEQPVQRQSTSISMSPKQTEESPQTDPLSNHLFRRNSSMSSLPTDVTIPYQIDWIFGRLRRPSKFWYIASQFVITAVGLFSKVLLWLNRTRVYNKERLVQLIAKRPKGVPLVTVSNHYSCFDDPGLWGILPIRQVCNTLRIRWSMAAHDICFTNKYHSLFFLYGKCIPVVRGLGVYQEAINLCIEKCAKGHWVHVFPEGKVNMNKEELRLKWGVGRIIYESPKIPIILPLWHEGMDDVLPNVEPYVLQWRKKVTINIGSPLDLNQFVEDLKKQQVPEPAARKLITDKIQDAFRDLRLETEKLHRERN